MSTNPVNEAAKTGQAVEAEPTYAIPLTSITKNLNPRQEPANLAAIGYSLLDESDKEHSLFHMAMSDDIEQQRSVVELFEEHENEELYGEESPKADLSDVDVKEGKSGPRLSICSLASSINEVGQLEDSAVSRGGKRADGGFNYTLIFGQRRVAAIVYAVAANAVAKASKEELPFPNIKPVVKAKEMKVTEDEAFDLAVRENMDRKNFDPAQEGQVYYDYTKRTNPETGKKWNLKDVAQHVGRKYAHVRNRHALALPFKADKVDEAGNVVKKGRGLTAEERELVRTGKKTLTWAIRKALREDHYSDGTPQTNRDKPIPLGAMKELFDNTSDDATDIEAVARRKAIAECMGKTLKQAIKESEKRIKEAETKEAETKEAETKEAETKEARAADKGGKGKGKKGKLGAEESTEAVAAASEANSEQ